MYSAEAVKHGRYQGWHISLHMPDDGVLLQPMLFFQDFWVKEGGRINTEQSEYIQRDAGQAPEFILCASDAILNWLFFPTQCLCNVIILPSRPLHLFG